MTSLDQKTTNDKVFERTEYFTCAYSYCDTCTREHGLSGTGKKKSDIQPLITETVKDLLFYYDSDKHSLKEVKGEFIGTQDTYSYVDSIGIKRFIKNPIDYVNKIYVTKKLKNV